MKYMRIPACSHQSIIFYLFLSLFSLLPPFALTSREDGVGVEVLTDIDVALHDGVEGSLMNADNLHTQEGRLEDGLRAAETLVTDGDDLEEEGLGGESGRRERIDL